MDKQARLPREATPQAPPASGLIYSVCPAASPWL